MGSCAQLLTAASCFVWTLDSVKMETETSVRSCDQPRDVMLLLLLLFKLYYLSWVGDIE